MFCNFVVAVKRRILRYQSGSLGLFPLRPFGGKPAEGHVRDNVYCAQVVWALALAYRYTVVKLKLLAHDVSSHCHVYVRIKQQFIDQGCRGGGGVISPGPHLNRAPI